jgi:hypothetical protein
MTQLSDVVRLLKVEHDRLSKQIQGISAALAAFGTTYTNGNTGRRKISAAGRARIAEAQRQRWAKIKGKNAQAAATEAPKRTLSAAARKKIAAAQRLRWKKLKAAH